MRGHTQDGQARLSAILLLVGLIVAGVWVWKRVPPDAKETFVERATPVALVSAATGLCLWWVVRRIVRFRRRCAERDRLIAQFERTAGTAKKLDLAFALIEVNRYRLRGLEGVAQSMRDLFLATMKTAVGDEQHRLRGMAASHLGVLQDRAALPCLLAALDDDHAYVRACAALALGRMRAVEAKEKLTRIMQDDWDQTVRSRAREALERIA